MEAQVSGFGFQDSPICPFLTSENWTLKPVEMIKPPDGSVQGKLSVQNKPAVVPPFGN